MIPYNKILKQLNDHKTILYPTDTVWGLGCDATSVLAVKKIFNLKNREENKSLIVLVSSIHMLKKYVSVPKKVIQVLKSTKKPTTIIYNNPKNIAANIINKADNTLAVRIVQDDFCRKLIKRYGKPIVSTSANKSGDPTPKSFSEIDNAILKSVDYVVNLHKEKITAKSSTILKIEGDNVITIRK